jgi:hypothetical protein
MQLAYAFIADAATLTPDGKLGVLGGDFQIIQARQFPAIQPAISLVLKVRGTVEEWREEHHLQVRVVDSSGQSIHPDVDGPIPHLKPALSPDLPMGVAVIVNYQGIQFHEAGDYAFRVALDRDEVASVLVRVVRGQALEESGAAGEEQAV